MSEMVWILSKFDLYIYNNLCTAAMYTQILSLELIIYQKKILFLRKQFLKS